MSASYVLDWWERGLSGARPHVVDVALQPDERLLWTASVSSRGAMKPMLWLAVFFLAGAVIFGFSSPWGQTAENYCGPKPLNSCLRFYHTSSVVTLTSGLGSLWLGWRYFCDARSPWAMRYAITDRRAIAIDGRTPTKLRSADLRFGRAMQRFGTLTFGGKSSNAVAFAGLDRFAVERALYWATEGRDRLCRNEATEQDPVP